MVQATSPTHEISINKLGGFFVTDSYAEGHTLNTEEASALNQLKRENCRNNHSKKVTELLVKAKTEGREPTEQELHDLRSSFQSYESTYSFASKRAPKAPFDPIQAEAKKIATSMILEALAKKGKKKAELADGVFDKLVEDTISRNINGVVDEAKRRHAATKAAADDSLAGLLGDLG